MYDVIILGAGPGGYEAADLSAKAGLKTALIEKNDIGGTCLNRGCIPLKNFLHISKVKQTFDHLQKLHIINNSSHININQKQVITQKDQNIISLRSGVQAKLSNTNIDIYPGKGLIQYAKESVSIQIGDIDITGKRLIIATGSHNNDIVPPELIPSYQIIDSDHMLELQEIPSSLIIIGAGVIGIETASYFNTLGSSVTLIEQSDYIGGHLDREISKNLQKILEKKGITFFTGTQVTEFQSNEIICTKGNNIFKLSAEYVMVCVGRSPNIDELGLENTNIIYDKNGIKINEKCETTNPLISACGDVTGILMLAHVAYKQAEVIIDNWCGRNNFINYHIIPSIIYSSPEVVSVGLTEDECQFKKIDYVSKTIPMTYSGRYLIENGKDNAIAKMIITKDHGEILGFSIVGNNVSELALALEIILSNKMTLNDLQKLIYPHPTVSEIIHELAQKF